MEFLRKYGWLIVLIVLLGAYFFFKEKIDRLLGIVKDVVAPGAYSCSSTFYAKLSDGKTVNVWTSDEGTTGTPNIKYYKQSVVLDENGANNLGGMATITKEEFDGFCKDKYEPAYAWYTSKPIENPGHTGGRPTKMHGGGMAGHGGHGSVAIVGSYGYNIPQYYPLFDRDGKEVNTPYNEKKKACPSECLHAHPKGSQYYGYYYCQCQTLDQTV